MGYKRGPMWGSTCAADVSASKQLARVELEEPRDVTVYLYGWNTPDSSNNTAGFYDISIGAGGTAFKLERVAAAARGRVLHFVTANLVVDAVPPGFSLPARTMAKAHIGLGRPTESTFQNGLGSNSIIPLPPWTTQLQIVAAFTAGSNPPGPAPADAQVQVAQANDPLFTSPVAYELKNLMNGIVPISQMSGFFRVMTNNPGGMTIAYQVKTLT